MVGIKGLGGVPEPAPEPTPEPEPPKRPPLSPPILEDDGFVPLSPKLPGDEPILPPE